MKIKVTFMDPGCPTKSLEIEEVDLEKTLRDEALKMNYTRAHTRAHVRRPARSALRWSKIIGVTFVRALGSHDWRDWAMMDDIERQQWKEQDQS